MKITRKSILFNAILFIALLLNLVNLKLFEKTIIPIKIIATFYALGILSFILFKNKLKELSPWNPINNFILCLFVVGSCTTVSFLGINYYFAEKATENRTCKIIRKTEIQGPKYNRGKKTPAVIIETKKNSTKRIEFKRSMRAKIDEAHFLELELSNGFFNFDIIRNTKLK
ncbi:hypothetical protein [Chryseobacterium sp. OSA05B]|uniref:hypothetical protein n=1 Tax=Chryseobacterium sp. OSA05B TaxID=2862650 RepID=UPI001CBC1757|nr:hypothetical protein [Chryseobacterium sp. OSA05B]